MAFNIGYVGLCDRDIKYTYTTTKIKPPATRKPIPYKPDFLREQERERQEKLRNRRFMQYYPKHEIELPRAPAYRVLPSHDVDNVVSRLMKTSSERFDFKFSDIHKHQDWRQARDEKIRRLRDVMAKFGATPNRPEPETGVDIKTTSSSEKKGRKRKDKNEMHEYKRTSIIQKSDFVEKLPPVS